jgi:transcriptional regulator with XRE-family HTH domain
MPDKAIARRFAENLAHHMAKSPRSREEISVRAEIHRVRLAKLLKGEQVPRLDTVVKLAGALDIAPADLLEGMIQAPPDSP